MTPKQKLIEALRRLCTKHGIEAVAEKAEVSAENLQQIVKGTLLPKTGQPRGVGPGLQRKLAEAFPGWDGYPPVVVELAELVAGMPVEKQRHMLWAARTLLAEPSAKGEATPLTEPTHEQ